MKTSRLLVALLVGLIASESRAQSATWSLANTSALVNLAPGSSTVIGFVVAGPASGSSLVMVRAVGPTLSMFGIKGTAANPQFQVFGSDGKPTLYGLIVLGQIDWNATFASVGAFPLNGGGQFTDAMGLFGLPPDAYSVQASDHSGNGGQILVEVYLNVKIVTIPGSPT